MKLNSKQLRNGTGSRVQGTVKNEIYIILDNVLDTYNIGSIFRLADAVGAKKLILCGGSETPPNPRIKKASINTTTVVDWEYFETTEKAITRIKKQESRIKVVAVEQAKGSIPYNKYDYQLPIALVVGHETEGVSKSVLDMVDGVVEMPMHGINISLNVVVSLAVVLFKVLEAPKN
jgi:23S rRNA (guanosine2251-2'-O)-methyltransferase